MLYKIGIVIAYLICGLTSAWLFNTLSDFFTPGLLFISVTIAVALIGKSGVRLKSIFFYYLFSYCAYLAVFLCTIYCGSAGVFTGIFFSGAGAYTVFWLTNKYVAKIDFRSDRVFLLGSLSFLANILILVSEPVSKFIKPVYDITQESRDENLYSINILFAPSFLFWQLFVGTRLGFEIVKYRRTRSSSERV